MTDPVAFAIPTSALARSTERKGLGVDALHHLANEMEAAFVSEMLGHAGLGQASENFGGGIGEEQFSSFLRQQQATAMVRAGGIGLAESLFHALTEGRDART